MEETYSLLHLPTGIVFPLDTDRNRDYTVFFDDKPIKTISCDSMYGCPGELINGVIIDIDCSDCPLHNGVKLAWSQFELQITKK